MQCKLAPKQQAKKQRSPAGVTKAKPIALRLPAQERIDAEQLAGDEMTLSALAYKCYKAGLNVLFPNFNVSSLPRAKRGASRSGGAGKNRAAASLSK